MVASGSLLPSIEDWFGARRELRVIQPLLEELNERHPNIGIGVRPRGPLLFRVAEQMSLISDALYLEATRTLESGRRRRRRVVVIRREARRCSPEDQARRIAEWIYAGRGADRDAANSRFPVRIGCVSQPSYSDREWILAIADQYRTLDRRVGVAAA